MANEETGDGVKLLDPSDDIKPRVTKDVVPELVERLYGLKITSIKELPSYDDLNFFITVDKKISNEHMNETNEDGYVFKILNSLQSSQPQLIEAQHFLKKHIRERGIPTQVPIFNKKGHDYSTETFTLSDGKVTQYIVRLVTYIKGTTYVNTPYVPGTFVNVGKFLGRFHQASEGFQHPFYDTYNTVWSLTEVSKLRNFLHVVKDERDASVVKQILDCYEKDVVLKFDQFRKGKNVINKILMQLELERYCIVGIVHGDFNEQNLVMKEMPYQDNIPQDQRVHDVVCILDFFDAMSTYPVLDVAINIMYASLDAPVDIQLDVGGYILAGYQQFMTLSDVEFDCLVSLVCARLCQSLVYGAHGYMLDPDNTYLLTTAKRGWGFLHRLWEIPKEELLMKWKQIMTSQQTFDSRNRK